MPYAEVLDAESRRSVLADGGAPMCPFADAIELGEVALLFVVPADLHPSLSDAVERLCRRLPELVVVRARPHEVDVATLWYRLDARTKIQRLGLPTDRLLFGFYLFEEGRLRGWHPLVRFGGLWVEQRLESRRTARR